jgi:translation elongation factor EF-1beta
MEEAVMDEHIEQTSPESGVTRRVIARSAAAGGLAALFAAVGAGRVLAEDDDENTDTTEDTVDTVDDVDTADTVDTAETADTADTADDDESEAGLTGGATRSKGKKLHKGGKRGKGHH